MTLGAMSVWTLGVTNIVPPNLEANSAQTLGAKSAGILGGNSDVTLRGKWC